MSNLARHVGRCPLPRRAAAVLVAAIVSTSVLPIASALQPSVTFSRDVAPILFRNCALCHHDGGAAPFSVLRYEPVRQRARQLAQVVTAGLMPPWKADGAAEFVGQRHLTETEIDVIAQWARNGAVEGDPRDLPAPPAIKNGWTLGEPDLIISAPEAVTVPADGADFSRILVLPIPVRDVRFVRGVEFRPGNPRVVHHANMRIDRTGTSRSFDAADPGPGYEGLLARTAIFPDGHFLGWTPGQVAPFYSKGIAWPVAAGTDLVVELHLTPSGRPEVVQPTIGLFFTGDAPERSPAMLRLGHQNLKIPAGERNVTVTDSFELPTDVEVWALQPHAHSRTMRIYGRARLPDGTIVPLITIRDWDVRWQHVYQYARPVALPRGSTLLMEIVFDNSAENPRNPDPAQTAFWGQRSSDEMGDLWIQVMTRNDRDRVLLNEQVRRKMLTEDIVGYETRLRLEPDSVPLHDDAALLYLELQKPEGAVRHFQASLAAKPVSAAAHFNLATALTAAARGDEALAHFRHALELSPDYSRAHTNIGFVLASQGKLDAAADEYRAALRANADDDVAHRNLAEILLRQGDTDSALSHAHESLRVAPRNGEALRTMARVYLSRGEWRTAIQHIEAATRAMPESVAALMDLSWLLAQAPDREGRDATRAIVAAEQAVELSAREDAAAWDALGVAYAAGGFFQRATLAAEAALRLASPPSLRAAIEERLARYRSDQP